MKKILKHKSFLAATFVVVVLYGMSPLGWSSFRHLEYTSESVEFASSSPTLQEESTSATSTLVEVKPPLLQYIEVLDSCGEHFEGTCVNMRSGPSEDYPIVLRLRTGIVLRVVDTVTQDGQSWYKIGFDAVIHYPERITGDWYVAAPYVRLFEDEGIKELTVKTRATTTKSVIVDLSEQMLYAYDGDNVFMKELISAGLEDTPTPRGMFTMFKKTPSRYMQGPLPNVSDQVFDLPGVPWNLYFTHGGAVIHGAYWHNNFGDPWSHGCVNLPPQKAKELYEWAPVGMSVTVRD